MLSCFSPVRFFCDPMDYSPPDSSVCGISQARILEWVAMSSSRGFSQPRDQTHISCSSCIAGRFFTDEPPGNRSKVHEHPWKIKTLEAWKSSATCKDTSFHQGINNFKGRASQSSMSSWTRSTQVLFVYKIKASWQGQVWQGRGGGSKLRDLRNLAVLGHPVIH